MKLGNCFLQAYKREQRTKGTRKHRAGPSDSEMPSLRKALQSANRANQKLCTNNDSLCRQVSEFKRMEISWVKQKTKLMHDNVCIQKTLERKYNKARNEINRLEMALNAAKSNKEETDRRNEEKIKESRKETEAHILNVVEAEWKSRRRLREEKLTTELKEIQEKCCGQQEEIKKKEEMISGLLIERLALVNDLLQTAQEEKDAREESERQWKIKCEALEVRLREEQAKREKAEKVSLYVSFTPITLLCTEHLKTC